MKPWLHIIGIGEDGMAGLAPAAIGLVESAEVIIGGDRHHKLSSGVKAERVAWPSPFDAMIDKIRSFKGRRVVVLVSGDPLWYSVGARIGRAIDRHEICYHPQLSAFQLAACRMGWSLADVETLTIHGRPAEQIVSWFAPGQRLLVLTKDASSPDAVATLLCDHGYGNSRMSVLAAMGGRDEMRFDGIAESWNAMVPDLHTLAIECVGGPAARILPKTGLPDDVFCHDGKMTKQSVRAMTLARLAPQRGELLWDIGVGSGSVAIEWIRAARDARAIGIEPKAERRQFAALNALALGAPGLKLIDGSAPDALGDLERPDAIFIGGGASSALIDYCIEKLKPLGRLVVNAVTLESEALLFETYRKQGGELQRVNIQSVAALGSFTSWKSAIPVTQWVFVKPWKTTGGTGE